MAYIWGAFSFVMLVLSVAAHAYTFIPATTVSTGTWSFLMFLGIVVAFGAMCIELSQRKDLFILPEPQSQTERGRHWNQKSRALMRQITNLTPRPVVVLFVLMTVYVFVNFAISFVRVEGQPELRDGVPILTNHGTIRPITMDEYQVLTAYHVRDSSGHWMIFSLAPTIYFWIVRPRLQKADSTGATGRLSL